MLTNAAKGTGERAYESLAMKTVTFIKQIFYCEEYWKIQSSHNVLAGQKYVKDKKVFLHDTQASVAEAEKQLFLVHQNSTLRLAEPRPEHETVLAKALEINQENVDSSQGLTLFRSQRTRRLRR